MRFGRRAKLDVALVRHGVVLSACLAAVAIASPALSQSRSNAGPVSTPAPIPGAASPASEASPQSASPAPAPSATMNPRKAPAASRLYVSGRATIFFGDQQYAGPGVTPPEAASYAAGGIGPPTPYDFFTGAPTQSGVGSTQDVRIDLSYNTGRLVFGARVWAENVAGSAHVDSYWNEPLLFSLSPHQGARAFSLPIAFPTHAGQDDVAAFRGSITQGWVATPDGNDQLRVGVFNDVAADRFVYAPPPVPGAVPAVAPVLPQTLGDGPPGLDDWKQRRDTLPLAGSELTLHRGIDTFDVGQGSLPAMPGTGVLMTVGSFAIDHGGGLRYSADFLHINEFGSLGIPALYGADAMLTPGAQGISAGSTVSGQRETIGGLRAAVPFGNFSVVGEVGRSWYSFDNAAQGAKYAGSSAAGYYHAGAQYQFPALSVGIDWFRFEPQYGTIVLPYGTPENTWPVAFAWPAPWLNGYYQIVGNADAAANRQGPRVEAHYVTPAFDVRAQYAAYTTVGGVNISTAANAGFVDAYFPIQLSLSRSTLGLVQHAAAYVAWHPGPVDVSLDLDDDTEHRDPLTSGAFGDYVTLDEPQAILTLSHPFGKRFLVAGGVGRFALRGNYASGPAVNADLAQAVAFAGTQFRASKRLEFLVGWREYRTTGIPVDPGTLGPAYNGSQVIVEQRLRF